MINLFLPVMWCFIIEQGKAGLLAILLKSSPLQYFLLSANVKPQLTILGQCSVQSYNVNVL